MQYIFLCGLRIEPGFISISGECSEGGKLPQVQTIGLTHVAINFLRKSFQFIISRLHQVLRRLQCALSAFPPVVLCMVFRHWPQCIVFV